MPHVQSSRVDLKLKVSRLSIAYFRLIQRVGEKEKPTECESVESERERENRKILQTTKRNARIITLAAIALPAIVGKVLT